MNMCSYIQIMNLSAFHAECVCVCVSGRHARPSDISDINTTPVCHLEVI